MDHISSVEARKIALNAQGFGEPRPRKTGLVHVKATIDRLRLIQIDSVNVLVRAHYMPFFSRLGPYRREWLDDLAYRDQYVFEQWAHEACFIPIEDYPLLHHQMSHGRRWRTQAVSQERLEYFDSILAQVRDGGPAVTGKMENAGRRQGWWGWSHAKTALEYQFAHGRLAVRERRNFARVYDVPERVFHPSVLETPGHPKADAHRQMVRNSLAVLGVATIKDIADYYRLLVGDVRPRIQELVDSGEARPLEVEGWTEKAYVVAGVVSAPDVRATALLSPFDNLIWDRARTQRLFDFYYRIEIYTPAPNRVFGYYVLPFLNENRLAARVDLKANRQQSTLQARAIHLEPGAPAAKTAAALARELKSMAGWLGLERVEVGEAGDLAPRLAGHFRS